MKNEYPVANVYGQQYEHDALFVVANKEALIRLRDMCDALLENEELETAHEHISASDGEEYPLILIKNADHFTSPSWTMSYPPYNDFKPHNEEDLITPADRLSKESLMNIYGVSYEVEDESE